MISHRTRIVALISFLLAATLGALVTGGVIMLERAAYRLQTEKQDIIKAQLHETAILQLSREFDETAAERAALDSYFVPQDGIVDFLALIETIGARQGVTVTTAALEVVSKGAVYDTLRLEVRASGSRDGVLHVLETLEALPYASHVSGIALETAGTSGVWDGVFTIMVAQHKEQ